MKVAFILEKTVYNCILEITDVLGTKRYTIDANTDEDNVTVVDINGSSFKINIIPSMPSMDKIFGDIEVTKLSDRIAKRFTKTLVSALDKFILLVGCSYTVDILQEGDRFHISTQMYLCDIFDKFDILGLTPISYIFYELARGEVRYKALSAFSVNRKLFLKTAKKFTLTSFLEWGIFGIIAYPLQMLRVKHLAKDKKISRTIVNFHNMTEEQRQRYLKKIEKL